MKRIIEFFIDRSLLVNLIMVAVCIGGAIVASMTPRSLMPREVPRSIEVTARLPGASALDVERFITFRLEEALLGMEDIERVDSSTQNGQTRLSIRTNPDVEDLTKPLEEVRSRLTAVQHRLPDDLLPLRIRQADRTSNQAMMMIVVEHVDHSKPEHRAAVNALADRLRRVPDVVFVETLLSQRNLYIRFSREKMDRAGLSVTLARQRIAEYLGHLPIGAIRQRHEQVAIELARPFENLDGLRNLPLRVNRLGKGVALGDVAQISYDLEEQDKRHLFNGSENYSELWVRNAFETDSINVSNRVRKMISSAKQTIAAPLKISIRMDSSEVIKHELDTLLSNGLGGIVIVLLILMAFLGWRVGAMTAIGLPFSYLGICLLLPLFNVNFDLISLVAMILVIGILVDDAIIVSEEYCQQLARGLEAREAAVTAINRVAKPVLGMVATTTVAFMPIALIKWDMSWLLRPLPIVIIVALALSFFESFLLLPNHLKHLIKHPGALRERKFVLRARDLYGRILSIGLRLRYVAVLIVGGLFFVGVQLAQGPVKFKDDMSFNGRMELYAELHKPAQSLDELQAKLAPVFKLIDDLPNDMVGYHRVMLGQVWMPNVGVLTGWQHARVHVVPPGNFVEAEERRHLVAARLREPFANLVKTNPDIKSLTLREDAGDGDTRDMVTIYVSGGDRVSFTEIQDQLRQTLKNVPDVQRVYMDESRLQRSYRFVADERKILAYELTKLGVQRQLREHFSQKEILRLRHKGEENDVILGFQKQTQPNAKELGELTVITQRGVAVPLNMLGKWKKVEVLRRIEHRDMLRMFRVDVLYNKDKTDSKKIAAAIEDKLSPLRKKYAGYHISVKPSEAQEKTKAWAIKITSLCVVLIYFCLALSLGSLIQPIIVIFAIPFGFLGVVIALYAHGMHLGVMAIIGVLGLAGVVVNDSLVMTTTINDAFRDDPSKGLRWAIVAGAKTRFRAVILTSLTTLGGVFPLAYGLAGKAGWIQPMVFAVGWGLLFATLLTLFFIPCLLLIVDDIRRLGGWIRRALRNTHRGESMAKS